MPKNMVTDDFGGYCDSPSPLLPSPCPAVEVTTDASTDGETTTDAGTDGTGSGARRIL